MFYDVVIFEGKLVHVAGGKLGITIPSWIARKLEERGLKGAKVIVHIYIPKHSI